MTDLIDERMQGLADFLADAAELESVTLPDFADRPKPGPGLGDVTKLNVQELRALVLELAGARDALDAWIDAYPIDDVRALSASALALARRALDVRRDFEHFGMPAPNPKVSP